MFAYCFHINFKQKIRLLGHQSSHASNNFEILILQIAKVKLIYVRVAWPLCVRPQVPDISRHDQYLCKNFGLSSEIAYVEKMTVVPRPELDRVF